MAVCQTCRDTGIEDTGNGDFPCHCGRGDRKLFNTSRGQEVGAEVRRHMPWQDEAGRRYENQGAPYRQEHQQTHRLSFSQRLRDALEPYRLHDPLAHALFSALQRGADPELLAVEVVKSYADQAAYLRDVAKRAIETQIPSVIVLKKDEG